MEALINVIFNSLIILGLYIAAKHEKIGNKIDKTHSEILWFLSFYPEKYLGRKWSKPLFGCPGCMASVWGMTYYLTFVGLNWAIVPHILAVCGLNVVLYAVINR
jgi:hypothetical protein